MSAVIMWSRRPIGSAAIATFQLIGGMIERGYRKDFAEAPSISSGL
jgi:hypothetical protein